MTSHHQWFSVFIQPNSYFILLFTPFLLPQRKFVPVWKLAPSPSWHSLVWRQCWDQGNDGNTRVDTMATTSPDTTDTRAETPTSDTKEQYDDTYNQIYDICGYIGPTLVCEDKQDKDPSYLDVRFGIYLILSMLKTFYRPGLWQELSMSSTFLQHQPTIWTAKTLLIM